MEYFTKLTAFEDNLLFPVSKIAVVKNACNSTISVIDETKMLDAVFQPEVKSKVDQLRVNKADLLVFVLKIGLDYK